MSDLIELLQAREAAIVSHHERKLGKKLDVPFTLEGMAVAEIERLRAALQRVDALNDNPAHFNSEINEVVMQALEPSSHQ